MTILAIDQGTTSTRAIVFDAAGAPLRAASRPLTQYYPRDGWVEHDPEQIWTDTLAAVREVLDDDVAAIGIANQRETIVLWDRRTGQALHPAIVWQDRRTAAACRDLRNDGVEPFVQARTGLLLDPYFSASKLRWLLDAVPGAREQARDGALAAGTIETFLLWRFTGGRVHATDITNASRTLLFDIHAEAWDDELLRLFDIPAALLPEVHGNSEIFGETDAALFGRRLPIAGMAGDQQAALVGQGCFAPGMVKSTYGTGCFMLLNTGTTALASTNRLLATPAYRLDGETAYALEGSIFIAGAAIAWLRDALGLLATSAESARLAAEAPDDHGLYLVPAFVGLGAPHWAPDARAALTGLTLDSKASHIVRATLEAVAFQTCDLADAMRADGAQPPETLRIDGGMAENDWFSQFLADILDVPVERPAHREATARGAAWLAARALGRPWNAAPCEDGARSTARFAPRMEGRTRERLLAGWRDAVARALR